MVVDGHTRIFGVVGDPVGQVKTPGHINPIFDRIDGGILCLPFHVHATDLAAFWDCMKMTDNVVGIGVTIPHKRSACELCESLGPGAQRIGVVNAVRRRSDGGFHGENFDGHSFVNGLIAQGIDPHGHDVLIIGAGGAATAISFALIDAGINRLSILNRTTQHAADLAALLSERTGAGNIRVVPALDPSATLVINATSLGMNDTDPYPVDPARLNSEQIVAEVVASPEFTRFLRAAEKIGCRIHSGIHMITNQMEIIARFVTDGSSRS